MDSPSSRYQGPIDPAARLLGRVTAAPGAAALLFRTIALERYETYSSDSVSVGQHVVAPDDTSGVERALAALVATAAWTGTPEDNEALVPRMLKESTRAEEEGSKARRGDLKPAGPLATRQVAAANELAIFGTSIARKAAQPDALLTAHHPSGLAHPSLWDSIVSDAIEGITRALGAEGDQAKIKQANAAIQDISVRKRSERCHALLTTTDGPQLNGEPVPKHLRVPSVEDIGTAVDATRLGEYLSCLMSQQRCFDASKHGKASAVQAPPLVPVQARWPTNDGVFLVPGQRHPLTVASQANGLRSAAALGRQVTDPRDPLSVPPWAIGSPHIWKSAVTPAPWKGQIWQDRWVMEHVYPGLRGGFFVEAGAVDGLAYSNTLAMERYFNWSGVLVEARRECIESIQHFRPRSHAVRALLGPPDVTECTAEQQAAGMTSCEQHKEYAMFYPSGAMRDQINATARYMDASLLEGIGKMVEGGTAVEWTRDVSAGTIRAKSLQSVLREANAPPFIHFLSLDIEGLEWEVLREFDFDSFRFGALAIEHNFDMVQRARVTRLLLQKGYVRELAWTHDDLFLHRTVAQKLWEREQEATRRRRGRARRAGFSDGIDWPSAFDMHREYVNEYSP